MSWEGGGNDTWGADTGAANDSWAPETAAPSTDAWVPDTNGTTADENNWGGDRGDGGDEGEVNNISRHDNGDAGGNRGDACRNCGQTGHFARECTEPKKMTGECFNCGEIGHNKADCSNPRVERPFTGTCRTCNQEGHRAGDCPEKKPDVCKNCKQEGHRTLECKALRALDNDEIPDMEAGAAWDLLMKADEDRDLEDFRKALKIYAKTTEVDLVDLEGGLRSQDKNVYIIAQEREVPINTTIVSLNGKIDCKYILTFGFTDKPRRGKIADFYPKSPEENMERLKDCGFVMDRLVPMCKRCRELGHSEKYCKEEPDIKEPLKVQCVVCSELGHRARDCTKARVDPTACRNCKQSGHIASECTEPRSAEGVECRRCNETGHFSKDCPNNTGGRACRNCGDEGHIAKECPEPRNPANIQCRNCDEFGHMGRECPKPRDYSRVTCQHCGEKGHTIKRCKLVDQNGNDSGDGNGFTDTAVNDAWGAPVGDTNGAGNGDNSWDTTAGAKTKGDNSWKDAGETNGNDTWGNDDAAAASAGW